MEKLVTDLAALLWGNALIYLALGVGLYFTVATRFVQIRYLLEMVRLLTEKRGSDTGISSFQAMCMSLSGRIGVGNIAGVATAIEAGGPGAVFWMNIMAILGAASAFAESTLAQVYKTHDGDQYRGGVPWYIEHGLGSRTLAIIVAIIVCLCYAFLIPGVQANTITSSFAEGLGAHPLLTCALIVTALGLIIFGGIKRIASVADIIVPFMSIGYVIMLVIVLVSNASNIPALGKLILESAMGTNAIFGGIVGHAISWGVRRSVFSNAAGAGEGTYSAAAANVSHPAKQGLVQAFSVYIDTVLVCSATALMILSTNKYNVVPPGSTEALVAHIPGVEAGATFTQHAIETVFPAFGSGFVAIAIFFFAFTCLMTYYYIGETTMVYLQDKLNFRFPMVALKVIYLLIVAVCCTQSATLVWGLGDIAFALLSYMNLVIIVLLTKPTLRVLRDYEAQKKDGKNPAFDSTACGIERADFWKKTDSGGGPAQKRTGA